MNMLVLAKNGKKSCPERSREFTEGPNWNFVELKVKFLTEKFRVEMI